jgi:hypothetical protein
MAICLAGVRQLPAAVPLALTAAGLHLGCCRLATTEGAGHSVVCTAFERGLTPSRRRNGGVGTTAMPSVGSQTMRTLLGGGRPLARRDQLRPVSADT